jgi:hypothetical protein
LGTPDTKKNTTQYMCWTPLYTDSNNINKTSPPTNN